VPEHFDRSISIQGAALRNQEQGFDVMLNGLPVGHQKAEHAGEVDDRRLLRLSKAQDNA
jgi:hypothetical protein